MRADRSLVLAQPADLAPAPQGPYRTAERPPIRVDVRLPVDAFNAEEEWRRELAAAPRPLAGAVRAAGRVAYLGGCFLAGFFTGARR